MRLVLPVAIAVCSTPAVADRLAIAPDDAAKLLYGPATVPHCDDVACLIEHRYKADAKAKALALALFHATGDVAGVGPDEIMDGGYRGKIHLVPQLPTAGYRQHLAWVSDAMIDIDRFFTAQFDEHTVPKYRWRALGFRFVRSEHKRTPSAYAAIADHVWAIEYNVEGSLLVSAAGVRETLVHELFHLNDEDHGDWSSRALGRDYDAIVAKCGTPERDGPRSGHESRRALEKNISCLAPYAPNDTMVRGGTYYAFQQNNGQAVHEYAAELAVRYYKEQSEIQVKHRLSRRAFKCGPEPNARVWKAFVDEFFAGRDLVPRC